MRPTEAINSARRYPVGAEVVGNGVSFRVWAPSKKSMAVVLDDSHEIEAHADIVIFLHRPEMYEADKLELMGKAELHIAKHRGGPMGMVSLQFVKEHTRFHSVTRAYEAA